jgi:hypothetical protein
VVAAVSEAHAGAAGCAAGGIAAAAVHHTADSEGHVGATGDAGGVAAAVAAIAIDGGVAVCKGPAQGQACTAASFIIGATTAGAAAASPCTASCDVRTDAAQLSTAQLSAADGRSQSLAASRPACAVDAPASHTFEVSACCSEAPIALSPEAPTALSPEAPTALSPEARPEDRLLYLGPPGFSAGAHSSEPREARHSSEPADHGAF